MSQSLSQESLSVKVTYLNRQRRKRKRTIDDYSVSPQKTSPEKVPKEPALDSNQDSSSERANELNTSPAPKRVRSGSDAPSTSASSPAKKTLQPHPTSVVADEDSVNQRPPSPRTPANVPLSAAGAGSAKSASSRRTGTPGSDSEDGAYITDSTISSKIKRRREPERIEYFRNQPFCGKLDPHEVTCTKCSKTVKLSRRQTYAIRPWENHRRRCDLQPARSLLSGSSEREALSDRGSSPSSSKSTNISKKNMSIANDPQAESFGARHVVCVVCKMTIISSDGADHDLGNWEKHKSICHLTATKQDPSDEGATNFSAVSTVPFPTDSPHSATPTNTETTLNATDPEQDSSPGSQAVKNASPADDTKSAGVANGEEDSALGWMMLPFRSFVRGFRESLKHS